MFTLLSSIYSATVVSGLYGIMTLLTLRGLYRKKEIKVKESIICQCVPIYALWNITHRNDNEDGGHLCIYSI